MKIVKILFILALAANTLIAYSNNLQITNATRTGAGLDEIEFTLSWENSWNVAGAPNNHDAVWVFIKYRECGQTTNQWSHALLSTTMTDHSFGSNVTYATPITTTDRFGAGSGHNTGVMIRRSDIGIGDIPNQTIRLKIVGSSNGVTLDPGVEYDIKVFGIEMVYIPQGQYYIGDSYGCNSANYTIYDPTSDATARTPVLIASENSVTLREYAAYLVNVPNNFPKGYNSFYIMKYEITQQQYCNFLNTITSSQSNTRKYHYDYYQHDIQFDGSSFYTTRQDRPKPYLSFEDLLSYLDWAALRPLTEMEYEKACRGPLDFLSGEWAWGSGQASSLLETTTVSGASSGVEVVTDGSNCHTYVTQYTISGGQFTTATGGNLNYGPVAAGIYARSAATPDRISTGATYYGVMEMSGNLFEQCIQINISASTTASSYTGIWGNGQLTTSGIYDVSNWPSGTTFFIQKGGSYYQSSSYAHVSCRYWRARTNYTTRNQDVGGRGAR